MAILVVINNFAISGTRAAEFGNNSLISSLLKNNEESITETINTTQTKTANPSTAISDVLNPKEVTNGSEKTTNETMTTETQGALLNPGITTPTANGQQRNKVEYYIVEGGDTVSAIAAKFNLNPNTILWENKLGPRDYIKPGDKLTILPTDGVSYQVKKGDTLEKIAKTYSADVNAILEYNQLADASDISNNEILIIPGGQMPTPTPAATSVTAPIQYALLQIPPPARVVASARLLWPTTSHKINQYFGWRHTGVDIDGTYSSPIYAADDGRVEFAGFDRSGYGNHIIINHGGGIETLYGHASKIFVRVGDSVTKGQTIGMIGCTGWCTGPHVHFEVRIGGQPVNPLSYL